MPFGMWFFGEYYGIHNILQFLPKTRFLGEYYEKNLAKPLGFGMWLLIEYYGILIPFVHDVAYIYYHRELEY